jgi:hypothetical protein
VKSEAVSLLRLFSPVALARAREEWFTILYLGLLLVHQRCRRKIVIAVTSRRR